MKISEDRVAGSAFDPGDLAYGAEGETALEGAPLRFFLVALRARSKFEMLWKCASRWKRRR